MTGAAALPKDAVKWDVSRTEDCCAWQSLSPLPAQVDRALMDVSIDQEEGGTILRVTIRSLIPLFLHPGT